MRLPRTERRWLLLLVAVALVIVAGFSFYATPSRLDALLKFAGLGLLLLAIGAFLYNCYRVLREDGTRAVVGLRGPSRVYRRSLALWIVCCVVVLTLFPKGNRTLMDEVVVLSTSKTILEDREPYTGYSVVDTGVGPLKTTGGYVDKRPFLYATLVATVHGLLGYSPANAFYVNMALGAIILLLVWCLGYRLGWGGRSADLAMVSFASLPLFAQHVTGGGIDILNLALLALLVLLAIHQLRKPSLHGGGAMLGAGVLLAHARYESTMFMAIPIAVLIIGMARTGRTYVGWSTVVYLVSMVPLAAIHYLTFSRAAEWFQLGEKGLGDAFSFDYIGHNISHAVYFFFNREHLLANSPVLALAGLAGLLMTILGLLRVIRAHRFAERELVFGLMAVCVLGGFGVLMCYSWGELDSAIGSRLSLPLFLLLALAIGCCCRWVRRKRNFYRGVLILMAVSFYWTGYPVAAKNYNQTAYWTAQILDRCDEFLRDQPDRHLAVVTSAYPVYWVTREVFFMTPWALAADRRPLARTLFTPAYRRLYVVEVYQRNAQGKMVLEPKLGAEIKYEGTVVLDDLLNDDTRLKVTLVDRTKPFTVAGRVVAEMELLPENTGKTVPPVAERSDKP